MKKNITAILGKGIFNKNYLEILNRIMEKGTHGIDEKTFAELDYVGQARSLNAQILSVKRALNAHFGRAKMEGKDVNESKGKYIEQLERLIEGLK